MMEMTADLSRRRWLTSSLGLLSAASLPAWAQAPARTGPAHIVIVGGGATAAKYLKLFDPTLRVTVIEKNPVYVRPYGSSEVLNQHARMEDLNVSYDALRSRYGVEFVFDTVTGFDPTAWRSIRLSLWSALPTTTKDAQIYTVGHVALGCSDNLGIPNRFAF